MALAKGATVKQMKVRTLLYDLEVSPILGWTYGRYEQNLIKVEQEQQVMSISWKWLGDKKIHHASQANMTEKQLVTVLRDLLGEADIVIAHNAFKFDNKISTYSFLRHNLAPPSPYKTVDTLRAVKAVAKFSSNKLTDLCTLFGIGAKTEITYAELWHDCMVKKDQKAWKKLRIYNNQDIVLLEGLYLKLLPYIKNHPNLGDIARLNGVCPKCLSGDLEKRGFNDARVPKQKYKCNNCGGWCNEATLKNNGRTVNS